MTGQVHLEKLKSASKKGLAVMLCLLLLAGMAAAATAAELGGRILALLQALPRLQELLDCFAGYLQ